MGEENVSREYRKYLLLTILCAAFVLFWVILLTGISFKSDNIYNSYVLQAVSFLEGRLDLGQDYPWLELAIYEGKYFVSFPPFPTYVMLLPTLIFGKANFDYFVIYLFDLVTVIALFEIARHFKMTPVSCLLSTLFASVCSNLLFVMFNPAVWFIAQTMSFALCCLSIYCVLKKRLGLSLFWLSCSVGCRPMTFMFLPLVLLIYGYANFRGQKPSAFFKDIYSKLYNYIPALLMGISYMLLNYFRFKNPFEFGHNYLPEFVNSEKGQFSTDYILGNLRQMFALPKMGEDGKLFVDPFGNFSLLLASLIIPVTFTVWILVAVKVKEVRIIGIVTFVLAAGYIVFMSAHKTIGGFQFGCRYSIEIIPWIYLLLCKCLEKKPDFSKYMIPLALLNLIINVLGTVIVYNGY